jgi:putative membrane protein
VGDASTTLDRSQASIASAQAVAGDAGALAADGAQALADGVASSTDGMDQLTEAADLALEAGTLVETQAGNLADGGNTLADDAQALADDLDASAAGIGSYGGETRSRLGALAADPIAVEATRVNAVNGSQDGLAPFLMALAAWLGVMGAFLVLPAIWAADGRRWVRGVLVAFGLAALVGVAGSLLMVAGMRVLLDLQVADLAQLVAFAVLATLAFTAVVQALVAMFGSRGWLVALLLLVIQVAALGIPYAAPGPIAALQPFLPMTYAVDALRGAIAGGGSRPAIDALVLSAFLVVSLMITLAAAAGPALRRGAAGIEADPAA